MSALKPNFPLGGSPAPEGRATATCFCGAVEFEVPIAGPDFEGGFMCNCSDCGKVTGGLQGVNFTVKTSAITILKGEDKITKWGRGDTTTTHNTMTNWFCSICGSLMNRVSSGVEDRSFLRVGTVDDVSLREEVLKPKVEMFTADRVSWLDGAKGVEQAPWDAFFHEKGATRDKHT